MSRHRQQAVFHIESGFLISSVELGVVDVVLNMIRKDTAQRDDDKVRILFLFDPPLTFAMKVLNFDQCFGDFV
jgi:hypothetical protein